MSNLCIIIFFSILNKRGEVQERVIMKKILIFVFVLIQCLHANQIYDNERDFTKRFSINKRSDLSFTGASIMCVDNGNNKCNWNYKGYLYNATGLMLKDDKSFSLNSSTAILNLPGDSKIVWAGLYWQGHIWMAKRKFHHPTESEYQNMIKDYNKVVFKTPDGVKHALTADQCDSFAFIDNDYFTWNNGARMFYSCFKDVTDLVKGFKSITQKYTVGEIKATSGKDVGIGDPLMNWGGIIYGPWGGWNLVIVYQNKNKSFKNVSVFDGFKKLIPQLGFNNQECINIDITGFYTPKNGRVNSRMLFFSSGGEGKMHYDSLQMTDKGNNYHDVYNNLNPSDDQFNDSITFLDQELNSTKKYNPGIDIDLFDVSNIIQNEQSETNIKLCAKGTVHQGDQTFPSTIAFSTELYIPNVCYDSLKVYRANGEELSNGGQVQIGDVLRVRFDVKNMNYETAKKVYVKHIFDDNLTLYEPNSTKVKNINDSDLIPIKDNTQIGDLGVYYNEENKTWSVGIIGDSQKEFKPTLVYNNYIATLEFNATVENEGNITFDFLTSYQYSVGDTQYSYNDILPLCEGNKTSLVSVLPISSEFNIVNSDFTGNTDPLDPKHTKNLLYTQIVNKPFNVKLVHMDSDKIHLKEYYGLVRISVINDENATSDTERDGRNDEFQQPVFVKIKSKRKLMQGLVIPKAIKNARFRITYLKKTNGSVYNWTSTSQCNSQVTGSGNVKMNCIWEVLDSLYGGANCSSGNCPCAQQCDYYNRSHPNQSAKNNPSCLVCLFNNYGGTIYSRDNFAVRPAGFKITPITNDSKLIAGKNYTFRFEAVGENNHSVAGYNETIHLNPTTPTTVMLDYNDTRANQGCQRGSLQATGNMNFVNGIANVNINYSEVGDVNLTLKEIPGSEFASIDANDSVNPNGLYIPDYSKVVTFIPAHFKIASVSYLNGGNGFTYISNDLNMSSKLNFQLIAENEINNTTQNYSANCYAKNVDVNVSHMPINVSNKLIYKEQNSNILTVASNGNNISVTIPYTRFSSGTANGTILINLQKDYKNPVNPLNITLNDINATDSDNVRGGTNVNQSARFIYGRINIPNVAGYSSVIHNSVKFEYYNNNEWYVNTAHSSFAEGNISLPPKTIIPGVNMVLNPIQNGVEDVKYTAQKSPPFKTKGDYAISSWLWYHPKALAYQDPSNANHNCLTHPCNKIAFLVIANEWAGVGDNGSKYAPDNNNTAKLKSKADINGSKSQVKKLNW